MMIARRVPTPPPQWPKLVDNIPVSWHLVAPVADIADNAIKFVTESVVGYVIRDDEDHRDRIIAFSAACTHMGCIVQWNQKTRQFDCPCHSGRFDEYGRPDPTSPMSYLRSLPRLDTRVEDGNIYVAVPTTAT
jgi:Rieske Fe-S protein